ncbi:MAG: hypothetical protein LBS51_02055 [Oscillospiraceae bacterium]|jgi:hypothetical protein|nr:hypothetical protein [Oscillospiraceae bacterium]
MNRLKLKSVVEDNIIYLYQPEGQGGFGEISINISGDEPTVITKPVSDETGYYARKACAKIKEFIENYLPIDCTQAWY